MRRTCPVPFDAYTFKCVFIIASAKLFKCTSFIYISGFSAPTFKSDKDELNLIPFPDNLLHEVFMGFDGK